jgi:hypothetical protein
MPGKDRTDWERVRDDLIGGRLDAADIDRVIDALPMANLEGRTSASVIDVIREGTEGRRDEGTKG